MEHEVGRRDIRMRQGRRLLHIRLLILIHSMFQNNEYV